MPNKKVASAVAAIGVVAGFSGYKTGLDSGRAEVVAGLHSVPLSGQKIVLKSVPGMPDVFAVASPDLSCEHLRRLWDACPTNKVVLVAGRKK